MLLDGRVRFNATYFNYEYSDMQVSTIDTTGGNLAQQTDNAAEASRDGFEIDAAWAVTPSLRLKATYAFIDGDFDEFPDFLGLDVRAQPGMLPESAATFVMESKWRATTVVSSSLDRPRKLLMLTPGATRGRWR